MTHSSELESLKSVLDYDKDSYLKPLKKKSRQFPENSPTESSKKYVTCNEASDTS